MRISLRSSYLSLAAALGLLPVVLSAGCEDDVQTNQYPCTDSQPLESLGTANGFEQCKGGAIHRPTQTTCPSGLPRAEMCVADPVSDVCASDTDCVDQANGYCANDGQAFQCSCRYGCTSDADCSAGQLCLCGEPVGYCVSAGCHTDADCAGDLLCVAYTDNPGCGGTAFACQSADDQCASDDDCKEGETCTHNGSSLVCEQPSCVIGRPFLVAGRERRAAARERADWSMAIAPSTTDLPAAMRQALCAHWTEVGLMEHASIAAFARFALQLLGRGAPAELVAACHEAMSDETRHARIAFSLAAAYGERDFGPGALALDGALDDLDDASLLRLVVREGCIGETVAALEATEAATWASDPCIREVMAQIAADEGRHALLAWRYVAFEIARQPALAHVVLAEIDQAMLERDSARDTHGDLLQHGVIGTERRARLRASALAEVIRPCAVALRQRHTLGRPTLRVSPRNA